MDPNRKPRFWVVFEPDPPTRMPYALWTDSSGDHRIARFLHGSIADRVAAALSGLTMSDLHPRMTMPQLKVPQVGALPVDAPAPWWTEVVDEAPRSR